jgi:hypothetical protein
MKKEICLLLVILFDFVGRPLFEGKAISLAKVTTKCRHCLCISVVAVQTAEYVTKREMSNTG